MEGGASGPSRGARSRKRRGLSAALALAVHVFCGYLPPGGTPPGLADTGTDAPLPRDLLRLAAGHLSRRPSPGRGPLVVPVWETDAAFRAAARAVGAAAPSPPLTQGWGPAVRPSVPRPVSPSPAPPLRIRPARERPPGRPFLPLAFVRGKGSLAGPAAPSPGQQPAGRAAGPSPPPALALGAPATLPAPLLRAPRGDRLPVPSPPSALLPASPVRPPPAPSSPGTCPPSFPLRLTEHRFREEDTSPGKPTSARRPFQHLPPLLTALGGAIPGVQRASAGTPGSVNPNEPSGNGPSPALWGLWRMGFTELPLDGLESQALSLCLTAWLCIPGRSHAAEACDLV